MRYLFDPSTFNPKIQELIQYHVNVLEFSYGQDLNGSELEIYHVSEYILTLSIKTLEELDPTETFMGLQPINFIGLPPDEHKYLFQILISDKWPRRSHSKTT